MTDELIGRPATAAETGALAATLADAFAVDPVWGTVFADPSRRRAQHRAWFELVAAAAVDNAGAWTTGDHGAVAIWVPPGRPELDHEREVRLEATIVETCGGSAGRILDTFAVFEENHPAEEHWYLSLLGVRADRRGHGIGMRLLGEHLARLDALGAAAYLESSNPVNLPRYRAVGFTEHGGFRVPGGGPEVITMWRPPGDPSGPPRPMAASEG